MLDCVGSSIRFCRRCNSSPSILVQNIFNTPVRFSFPMFAPAAGASRRAIGQKLVRLRAVWREAPQPFTGAGAMESCLNVFRRAGLRLSGHTRREAASPSLWSRP